MTFHPWGGLLKRTLRHRDFPPGSASFLLPEANGALVSSLVMEWRWTGNAESEPMEVNRAATNVLSNSVKGWT